MGDFLSDNWVVVLVIALVAGAFLFLRTPADKLASIGEFHDLTTSGTPTLVEFFSNT